MFVELMLAAALGPQGQAINCSSQAWDLKKACAQELCGPVGTNPTIFVSSGDLAGFTPNSKQNSEIDRVVQLMDSSTQSFKTDADSYLNQLEGSLPETVDARSFAGIETLFAPYVSWRVEGDQIKAVTQFPPEASPELRAGVSEWAKNSEASAQNNFPLRLRLGLSSSAEVMSQLKKRFQLILTSLDDPSLPSEAATFKKQLLSQAQAFERPEPPYEYLQAIDGFVGRIESQLYNFTGQSVPATQNIFDFACQEKCLAAVRPFLTREALAKRISETRERLKSERPRAMDACRAGMQLQAKYGQTADGLEKSKELVEAALTSIEKSTWMSRHTAEQFGGFIREAVDVKPEFPSKLLAGDEAVNAYTQMARARVMVEPNASYGAKLAPLFDLSTVDGNLYGRDFRGCPSPRHLATDFFWQGIDKPLIHVSPHSCRHHDQGVATLAHELGHALSYFMSDLGAASAESTKTYLKNRDCVAKLTPQLPAKMPEGAQATFAFDRLTTEEDMADWVMQQAVPFDTYPLTCDFLKPSDDGKSYDPIMFDVIPRPDDTHSGGLMRIIREYQAKMGQLPVNCQQLMNSYTGIVEASQCL